MLPTHRTVSLEEHIPERGHDSGRVHGSQRIEWSGHPRRGYREQSAWPCLWDALRRAFRVRLIHDVSGTKNWETTSYESYVNASMEKDGSTVVVTCTLPQIQDGSIRYEVDQISLRDAEQKEVAALENKPTLRVALPEQQLQGRCCKRALYGRASIQ